MEQALDRDPRAATTDRQLLFDIGKRDERSFDILYHRYARPVAWTARSFLEPTARKKKLSRQHSSLYGARHQPSI